MRDLLDSNEIQHGLEFHQLHSIHHLLESIFKFLPDTEHPRDPLHYVKSMTSSLNALIYFKNLLPDATIRAANSSLDVVSKIDLIIEVPKSKKQKGFRVFCNLKSTPLDQIKIDPIRSENDLDKITNPKLKNELRIALQRFKTISNPEDMFFYIESYNKLANLSGMNRQVGLGINQINNYFRIQSPQKVRKSRHNQSVDQLINAANSLNILDKTRLGNEEFTTQLKEILGNNSDTFITAFCLQIVLLNPEVANMDWSNNPHIWNKYFKPAIEQRLKNNKSKQVGTIIENVPSELVETQQVSSSELPPTETKEEPTTIDVTDFSTIQESAEKAEETVESKKQFPAIIRKINTPEQRKPITVTSTLVTVNNGIVAIDRKQGRLLLRPELSIQKQAELFVGSLQDLANKFFDGTISQTKFRELFAGLQRLDLTTDKSLIRAAIGAMGDEAPQLLSQLGRIRTMELGYVDIDTCDAERAAGYIRDSIYNVITIKRKLTQTLEPTERNFFRSKLSGEYEKLSDILELIHSRCNDHSDVLEKESIQEALIEHYEADFEEIPVYLKKMIRLLNQDDYEKVEEILDNEKTSKFIDSNSWYSRDRLEDPYEDIEKIVATRGIYSIIDEDEYYFPVNND